MIDRIALLRRPDAATSVLESELLAEKAASLGHHGRLVEKAMAALRAFDAAPGEAEERKRLVRKAAHEVWAFFVQRELCGFRDQKEAIKQYGIPGEVLARLGAIER
ncbi:MAG: hypothetical protein HY834_01215 [Devosia nanyangense]|uniref:Uncharacterized protein n=1 Tax=Devosia nanyangense TaxID=1228055 RepID=A0A933L070_9HYPH|nr:hypothetical protein [Devosia nanyangense]